MLFSDILKKARQDKGMTIEKLAEMSGVSEEKVISWENGDTIPTADEIIRLLGIVNLSYDEEAEAAKRKVDICGMESIRELYKVGRGPSSSHTIGPERACKVFKAKHPDCDEYKVILYGSLSKTGKGHGTDVVIKKTLAPIPTTIEFNMENLPLPHPNTMDMFAIKNGEIVEKARVMSVGGGSIEFENTASAKPPIIYKEHKMETIMEYCEDKGIRLWEYALENEDDDFLGYMDEIWQTMKASIKSGLKDEGILPGGLNVKKKAKTLYESEHVNENAETKENRLVCAYAFAVSEQNAAGETIVTSPTCGSAGILPAVMYYFQKKNKYSDEQIINALITAGVVGNLIKTNASISGAECGCQAEVGTACAMASAALGELFNLNLDKIEYAAEIAIEHHLGLTCDPICGLVQIPCIERNAVAAMRAINAVNLSSFLWNTRKISFDHVVRTMKETGLDLAAPYRETSEGGLAKLEI